MRSKGGIALPPEIWDNILALCRGDVFLLVKPTPLFEADEKKVLSCQEGELDTQLGCSEDWTMLDIYEELLNTGGDIYDHHSAKKQELMNV